MPTAMDHSSSCLSRSVWLWCTIGVAIIGGCQTDPEIRVNRLDLVARGEHADEYAIELELWNPSEQPLVLDLWQYEVVTDGGSWSTQWVASRTLAARALTKDSLPVVIRHLGTPSTVTHWRVSGTLRYLLPGQLAETLFDLGVSRPSVDFSASGLSTPTGPEATAVDGS
ncbi:MAG: hypothetical protein EXS03_02985 [Phycisphaerales bacterium]|nr:hypothetical protein [Phycisphaerales bacterium]